MNRTGCDSINRVYETVRDAARRAVTDGPDAPFVLADILGKDEWREIAHSWASVVPVVATLHGCVASLHQSGTTPHELTTMASSDGDDESRAYQALASTWLAVGLENPTDEDAMEDLVTGDLENLGWTRDRASLAAVTEALVELSMEGAELGSR
ncbi:MAG: hypothetical protein ACYC1E_02555 [Propionibacteriaceae bacterium]